MTIELESEEVVIFKIIGDTILITDLTFLIEDLLEMSRPEVEELLSKKLLPVYIENVLFTEEEFNSWYLEITVKYNEFVLLNDYVDFVFQMTKNRFVGKSLQ